MSQKDDLVQLLSEARASRRNIFKQAATGSLALAAGSLLAGCGGAVGQTVTASNGAIAKTGPTPTDVLNFALNLEFLEAEYYSFAVNGSGIDAGVSGDVFPTDGPVPFSKYAGIAHDIYTDELNHVNFLSQTLGTLAITRPPVDLVNSFNAAASAAGIGSSFDPFSSEVNFILGAFIFEDVGVTAYHGGAAYLTTSPYLSAAAGILGIEAYHAGAIRRIIAGYGSNVIGIANKISNLRGEASVAAAPNSADETLTPAIVAGDSNAIAYSRTVQQVLNIVYLNASTSAASKGGFFPNGLNGNITTS
jgi:hypothetical protein